MDDEEKLDNAGKQEQEELVELVELVEQVQ